MMKVQIAGRGGVLTDASAAVLNVTAVLPDAPGYLTVYPCTPEPPNASNVNYDAGSIVANGVTAKLDANGDVCIYTHARTHILVDVLGFLPGDTAVTPTVPARFLDTRTDSTAATFDGNDLGNGPVGPTDVIKVKIADRGDVTAGASAAILNVTAVAPDGAGYLTVYPCTPEPPNASNVNYSAGSVVANGVTAKLDANGDVCIYTHARTHILVDVTGFVG